MQYLIRYTPEAMRDMDAVWNGVYEASKSYEIADRYVNEFIAAISNKREFPFSGIPLQYRGLFTGFYSVNYKKYKAFYRVRDNYVEVARIIMSKQDYMRILFGEPQEDDSKS
jgi:plasmid stabilization system protein ParE